jgi:hypothetical protein
VDPTQGVECARIVRRELGGALGQAQGRANSRDNSRRAVSTMSRIGRSGWSRGTRSSGPM